jgi:predicted HAD superfamily Cof-like phosphohydrolase
MRDFQDLVRDFHVAFNYPHSPAPIGLRSAEQRAHLMAEEPIETVIGLVGPGRAQTIVIGELLKAVEKAAKRRQTCASLHETIDGCMDTLVVTFGTLEALGITFEETMLFFAEVHRANMAKKDGPRDPVTDKQLKPPGWTPPDIEGVLARIAELRRARLESDEEETRS